MGLGHKFGLALEPDAPELRGESGPDAGGQVLELFEQGMAFGFHAEAVSEMALARRVEDEEAWDGYLQPGHCEPPRGPIQPARQVDRSVVKRLVDAGRRYARRIEREGAFNARGRCRP
jgi:hypothetical protein